MTPLLTALVDDAGLFPPSSLSMSAALDRHRESDSPMLSGRFLVPSDRVAELLSLLGPDEKLDVHLIGAPVPVEDPRLTVLAVETREPIDTAFPCYVEGVAPRELAGRGFAGKVRCSAISVADLTSYLSWAARLSLPFKATAGLHRAVSGWDGPDSHGWLNVLVATSRALSGGTVQQALESTDGPALAAEASALSGDLVTATRWLLHSFGSCDTARPVADAEALGLL